MPRKIIKTQAGFKSRKSDLVLTLVIVGVLVVVVGYGLVVALSGMGSNPQPTAPASAGSGDIRRIGVVEAKALVDAGTAVLVDTRTTDYYSRQHAEGALSLPAGQEAALLNTMPRDKLLIIYCTWPDEATSVSVALALIANGYPSSNVVALQGGYNAWVSGGYPVTLPE